MSTPPDQQPAPAPARAHPSTQQIPVAVPPDAPSMRTQQLTPVTPPGTAPPAPDAPLTTPAPVPGAGSTALLPAAPPAAVPAGSAESASSAAPASSASSSDAGTAGRPAPGTKRRPGPRLGRPALGSLALAGLAVVLAVVGLVMAFGTTSFWSAVPLWSAFATGCALLGLAAVAAVHLAGDRIGPDLAWRVGAGALVGLAAFWLLVVLPVVDTDRGFLLTAALGCLGVALWGAARRAG